ncbi:MAG TPA: cupin domain-containing protein [Thermoanaerobaculia bacterium]|nr:cupin domain-containing protein [Thermoanaerobaculia bacterium]
MHPRARQLIESLRLEPHPEGGFYRQMFKSPRVVNGNRSAVTAIYFLLPRGQCSRWHRVTSDEIWVHLEGGGVMLHTFDGRTTSSQKLEHFVVVNAGEWQAAEPVDDFALVACFVAPGFEFDDFTMMSDDREAIAQLEIAAPQMTSLI